jgi:hypothetical protein
MASLDGRGRVVRIEPVFTHPGLNRVWERFSLDAKLETKKFGLGGKMEEEKVIMVIPKCEKPKSGTIAFYNLIVTNNRLVAAKTGETISDLGGPIGPLGRVFYKAARDSQDTGKFAGKDLEEIICLDKNNWAIPFDKFDEIKVSKVWASSQCIIKLKLNKEGKKLDRHSSVPRALLFAKEYLDELQATLKNLAGSIVKT